MVRQEWPARCDGLKQQRRLVTFPAEESSELPCKPISVLPTSYPDTFTHVLHYRPLGELGKGYHQNAAELTINPARSLSIFLFSTFPGTLQRHRDDLLIMPHRPEVNSGPRGKAWRRRAKFGILGHLMSQLIRLAEFWQAAFVLCGPRNPVLNLQDPVISQNPSPCRPHEGTYYKGSQPDGVE